MTAERPGTTDSSDPGAESVTPSVPVTGTGADATTALGDGSRTDKDDPRIVAYGETEEAGAVIGLVMSLGSDLPDPLIVLLSRVQNDLVDLGADLCTPNDGQSNRSTVRIDDGYVARLERACDHFHAQLPAPTSFVIAGGTATAALLHHARTVVRRAERTTAQARRTFGDTMSPLVGTYLDRLSNLLFILARRANAEHGDTPWQPGLSTALGECELWEPPPQPTAEF